MDVEKQEVFENSEYDSSLESTTPVVLSESGKASQYVRSKITGFNRKALVITGSAVAFTVLVGVIGLILSSAHVKKQIDAANANSGTNYTVGSLSIGKLTDSQKLQLAEADHLSINGQLRVTNTVVIAPSAQPDASVSTPGQIYYDVNTNAPYYYDGTQYISLAPTVVPDHVTSIGGASGIIDVGNGLQLVAGQLSLAGDISLTAGSGITIDGTTITNSGVLSLVSASPQVTITQDGAGGYTLSGNVIGGVGSSGQIALFTGGSTLAGSILSQSGGVITVGGNLTVTGAITSSSVVTNSLSQTAVGSDVNISAGVDSIVFTAGGRTFTLPTSGVSAQTICTTAISCTAGSGQAVLLQPGAVQADSGAGSSIAVNNTGGGTLLQLQSNGSNVFVVNNNGSLSGLTVAGASSFNGATSVTGNNSFTVGTGATTLGGALSVSGVTSLTSNLGVTGNTTVGGTLGVTSTSGFTGLATFSGGVTISNNSDFTQTGSGGLSTGNGLVTLNGNTSVAGASSFSTGSGTVKLGSLGSGLVQSNGSGQLSSGAVDRNSATDFTSTLGVANGGTGSTTFASNGLLYGNNAGAVQSTVAGTSGQLLLASALGVPTFTSLGGDAGIDSSGLLTITKLQGTALSISSLAAGQVVQYNGASFVNGLITNTNLQAGTFANVTGTGALNSGSIASGFGTISTTNAITTTAAIQGASVTASGALQGNTLSVSGFTVNASGAITAVSGITNSGGYTQTGASANTFSGATTFTDNLSQTGAGSFSTGSGNVNLNGNTTIAGSKTFATGTGTASLNGNTTVSGANTFTVGSGATSLGGTLGVTGAATFVNNITVQGGNVTIGAAGTSGTLILNTTNAARQLALTGLLPTSNGTATIQFPSIAGGSSDQVCLLSLGNCVGSGSSVTASGSAAGYVPVFTTSNNITDSIIYQSGTSVGINTTIPGAFALNVQGGDVNFAGAATVGNGLNVTGASSFNGNVSVTAANSFTVGTGATTLGGTATVTGITTLNGALAVNATSTLNGNTSVTGASTLSVGTGTTTLGGALGVTGTATFTGNISQTGAVSFSTGSGAVNLNGDTTIAAGKNFAQTGAGTFGTGTGNVLLNGNTSVTGANTFGVGTGGITDGGALGVTGATTLNGGAAVTGTTDINTSGSAVTTIGNNGAALSIASTGLKVTSAGATSGITTLAVSGVISGATAGNTINGLIINGGALSGVTGISTNGAYTQTGAGANTISGATTFTAAGTALTVNNNANISGTASVGTLSVGAGGITDTGTLTVNSTSTSTIAGQLNLTAAALGLNVSNNATIGGTLAIQGANGLTVGTAGAVAGSVALANTTNVNLGVLQAAAPSGVGNATYVLPTIVGGATDTVCLITLANCAAGPTSVTAPIAGTTNQLAKFSGASTIANSSISDDGTTVSITEALTAASVSSGSILSTGAMTILPGGNLTIGATNHALNLQGNSSSTFTVSASGFTTTLAFAAPSGSNKTVTIPNETGTVCLQNSVNCGFATAGAGVTTVDGLAGALTINNTTGSGSAITINDASTTVKGIAQFSSDFSAAAGVIDTIQGITTTSAVQFGSLTLGAGGNLTLSNTGKVIGNNLTGTGSSNVTFDALTHSFVFTSDGGAESFLFPTSGGLGQVICTSGITCASGGGQAVILEPGSVQTASTNNTAIFINKASGTGNLLQLQSGGTDALVIDNSGNTTISNIATITTLHTNSITPTAALTVGATAQAFTLQGTGASVIKTTDGGFGTTIGFSIGSGGTAPSGAVNYQFQNNNGITPGTYNVCTTAGNCAGVGGGVTTAGGTAGQLSKFTSAGNIADSIVADNGSGLVTVGGNLNVGVSGSATVTLGVASTTSGNLVFKNSTNGNSITLVPSAPAANTTVTLPNASGTVAVSATGPISLDALTGQISCATCLTGGGGGGGGVSGIVGTTSGSSAISGALTINNAFTGSSTITIDDASTTVKGIASFNATNFSASSGAINTVQNIDTAASVTFGDLTLQGTNGLLLGSSSNIGQLAFKDGTADGFKAAFSPATLTANRTITLPDNGGVVVVAASGNLSVSGTGVASITNSPNFTTSVTTPSVLSSGALSITSGGQLSIGSTTQILSLIGSTSSTIAVTSGANSTTVGFTTPTGSRTISFPDATGTVCLQLNANCGFALATAVVSSLNGLTGALSVANATASAGVITIDNAAYASKGIASFNATNFTVTAGAVNTIQDIATTSTPSFAGITVGLTGLTNNGTTTLNDNVTVTGTASVSVGTGGISTTGNLGSTGGATISGGATITGATNVNTTGTANTTVGNATGTFQLTSNHLTVSTAGAIGGATTLTLSGVISGATSGNTINGLVISGGALSAITGYNQTSGNFSQGGAGTFDTASGQVNLNGNTAVTGSNTFNVGTGTTTLGGALNVTGTGTFSTQLNAGSSNQFQVNSTGNVTSGTINGQTISATANFTGSVAIQGAAGLTLGVASTTAGSLTFANATSGRTVSLQALNPVFAGNVAITIPAATVASDEICLKTTANCTGSGGAVSATGYAQNYVTKFNGTTNQITVSQLFDNGSFVGVNTTTANGQLSVVAAGTASAIYTTGATTGASAISVIKSGGSTGDFLDFVPSASSTPVAKVDANGSASFVDLNLTGNFAQTGAGSFSTSTGTVSLNGNTTVASGKSITIASFGTGLVTSDGSGNLSSGALDRNSASYFNTTLAVANGGTGISSLTTNAVLFASGTGTFGQLTGTSGQLLMDNSSGVPTFTTLGGDATLNSSGALTVSKLQGNTLTITSPTSGQYLRYNGSAFVNAALGAADITGTLFSLAASSGTTQNVTTGQTVSILAGTGANLTTVASATNTVTVDIISNPTFTGAVAVQGAGGLSIGVAGTTQGKLTLATTGAGSVLLQSVAQAGALTLNIPVDANGTDTVCLLTIANCTSAGGGVSTTTGAANYVARFTGPTTIGIGMLYDDGSHVGVNNTSPANTLNINSLITAAAGAQVAVATGAAGNVGLLVQGFGTNVTPNQTASLAQFQDSTGAVLTSIDSTGNLVLGAGQSLKVTGSASFPGSPTEGQIYYRTDTKQLYVYANGKWQADRSTATKIVSTSAVGGASTAVASANPEGADFVNASTTSAQTVINAAIAALPATGGSIYLMDGTYIVDGSISLPNNTTLIGAGAASIIKLKNAYSASIDMLTNSDTTTGTRVVIQNLQIDGNSTNQSAGSQNSILFNGMGNGGGGSARDGGKITNVVIRQARSSAITLSSSANSILSGNTLVSDNVGIVLQTSSANNTLSDNIIMGNTWGVLINTGVTYTTVSGNLVQGNSQYGIYAPGSNYNTITANTFQSNASAGIDTTGSYNTVTGNTFQSNPVGLALDTASASAIVTGNSFQGSASGITLTSTSNNNISANTFSANTTTGITVTTSNTNSISSNKFHDTGGATVNNAIYLDNSDNNTVTSNDITDSSCSTNCYAINVFNSTSDTNYLADNRFSSPATINDAGTGTVYANQSIAANGAKLVTRTANDVAAFSVQNAAGSALLTVDSTNSKVIAAALSVTNATILNGTLAVTGAATFGVASTTTGQIKLANSASAFLGTLQVANLSQATTYTLPASTGPSDTICLNTLANCAAGGVAGGFYINNQVGLQSTANFNIQSVAIGSVTATLKQLSGQTADILQAQASGSATALSGIDASGNIYTAAGQSLKVTGSASFPGSPTEGQIYYRTDTKQLYVYANGKWQADRSTATKIVADGSTSQTPEAADYVVPAASTSAETTINAAITALPANGGVVYLMEGTYQISAAITIPSNVTLMGAGQSTLIKIKNTSNTTFNAIQNTDQTNGNSRLKIQNLRLDGNKANNTSGNTVGIKLFKTGTGVGAAAVTGAEINDVAVENFRSDGINLDTSNNDIMSRLTVRNNVSSGINVHDNSSYNSITDSMITGNSFHGITGIFTATNLRITGNTIVGNSTYGIDVEFGSTYATISGNNMNGNNRGIEVSSNYATVTGNTIIGSTGNYGLELFGSSYSNVSGNMISGSANTGFGLAGANANYNTITGNTISGSGSMGMYLNNGASHNSITGNTLTSNAGIGVLFIFTANNNVFSSNKLYDNGGGGANDSIELRTSASNNTIADNNITDTAGSGYAINVNDSSALSNNLSNNYFSGTGATSLHDIGTGTIYSDQLDGSGNLILRGQAGVGINTTAPTASLQNAGGFINGALSTPAAPTVTTQGTAGSTSYTYAVTAYDGVGETLASTGTTIATGAATLTGVNFNRIVPVRVSGAVSYKIYRTASGGIPGTTGLIGSLAGGAALFQFDDTGLSGAALAPTANTTGSATIAGYLGVNTTTPANRLSINTPVTADVLAQGLIATGAPTNKGLVIQAAASQTADLQQFQDSNGAVLSKVSSTGALTSYGTNTNLIGLATPVLTLTTGTAGSTYYYVITATNAAGETIQSNAIGTTTNTVTLGWTAIPGATGYKIYRNTSNAFAAGSLLATTITNGTTVTFTDSGAATAAGLPPTAPTGTGLILQASASQTAKLFNAQTSTGVSVLNVDATNQFVGIDVASPSAPLQVGTSTGGTFTLGFETGSITPLTSTDVYPSAPWTVDNSNSNTGSYSARNGNMGNFTSDSMSFIKTLASSGTVSFYRKQNLNDNRCKGEFWIDAVNQYSDATYVVNWTQNSYAVSAGTHTFKWTYNCSGGTVGTYPAHGVWFDDIQITNVQASNTSAIFNGNVGIGNLFPTNPLDVTTGTSATSWAAIQSAQGSLTGGLLLHQGYAGGYGFQAAATGTNTTNGSLVFDYRSLSDGSVAQSNIMTIQGNGYVGIGTNAPNAPLQVSATSTSFTDGFETGAIAPLTSTDPQPWTVDNTNANTGTYSARSNTALPNFSSDSMQITKTLSANGTVSFYRKQNLNDNRCKGEFWIDAVNQYSDATYVVNWTQNSYAVSAGTHTFKWTYNCSGGTTGSSAFGVWFDDITITNSGLTAAAIITGGNVGIGTTAPGAQLQVSAGAAATVGQIIQAAASQTADLQQFQDSNGAVLSKVSSTGALTSYGTNTNLIGLATPVLTLTTGTAGSTYYYVITATNAAGETIQSNAIGTTTNTVTLGWTAIPGATGYKIYRNTSNAFAAGSLLATTITNGTTVTFTDSGAATAAGLPPTAPTGTGLTLQGTASQTAKLFNVQSAAGVSVLNVDATNQYVGIDLSGAAHAPLEVGYSSSSTFSDDFESGALAPFQTTGANAWIMDNNGANAHGGVYSAKSNSTGGTSVMSLTKTLSSAGTISFWLNNGCNGNSQFLIDASSNNVNSCAYTFFSFAVGSGTHTFQWSVISSNGPEHVDDVQITNVTASSTSAIFDGAVGIGTIAPNAQLHVVTASVGQIGQIIQGIASQTGDLLELQDTAGNVNASFNAAGNQLTLGRVAAAGTVTQGKLVFSDGTTDGFATTLQSATMTTGSRTITIPDTGGVSASVCLTTGNCTSGAGAATLQTAYTASLGGPTPEIKLSSANGAIDIQDADTSIAGNLLVIRASNGAGLGAALLAVNSTGQTTLQNSANSTTALQVLTLGGAAALAVDTTNSQTILTAGGTDAVLGAAIIDTSGGTNDFPAGWGAPAGWTLAANSATHTAGTTALTSTTAAVIGTTYQVTYTYTACTAANTLGITMGSQTLETTTSCVGTNTQVITATSTAGLSFTPNTTYVGVISNVVVKALTTQVGSVLTVKNSSSVATLEVRSSGATSNLFIGLNAGKNNTTIGTNNTALGTNALQSNTIGSNNTALGTSALQNNTTGIQNTATGYGTLQNNTTGSYNTATGQTALLFNTTGSYNTASGLQALYSNTTGINNTATGAGALLFNTTGINNTANGYNTLTNNTTGFSNTASGLQALYSNTTGSSNTATGRDALYSNTTGTANTATGREALNNLKTLTGTISATVTNAGNAKFTSTSTTGLVAGQVLTIAGTTSYNGSKTIQSVDDATHFTITAAFSTADAAGTWTSASSDNNTAQGYQAGGGSAVYTATGNSLFGYQAGTALQTGANYNSLFGYSAGSGITTGTQNVLLGYNAGTNLTTGSSNIIIGQAVNAVSATGSNQLNIGNALYGDLSTGNLGIGTATTPTNKLTVNALTTSNAATLLAQSAISTGSLANIGQIIQGVASQTGDLQQFQDSNSVVLSKVSSTGALTSYGTNTNLIGLATPVLTLTTGTAGSTYYYVITATNAAGETIQSNSIGTTTNTVTLGWTAIPGATGYKIYRNTSNAFTAGSLLATTITNGNTVSYTGTAAATTAGLPPVTPTGTGLLIQAAGNQTAKAFNVQNAAGVSVLNVDATNQFVGIDVTTPLAPLHVGLANGGLYTNGFESGVLTPFTTDGDSLWSVVSGVPNSGSFSAKAGSNPGCACAKVTNLRLTKTLTTNGTISFYRKLSLNGYTYKFQIDGVDQESITTDSGFTQATFAVSSGAHTFTWLYSSGSSPVANPVYIDDVVVTNVQAGTTSAMFNGNVGIGTGAATPNFLLDVNSGQSATSWAGVTSDSGNALQGGLLLHQNTTYGFQLGVKNTSGTGGDLVFDYHKLSDGSVTKANVLTLTGAGLVGIGTSGPNAALDIQAQSGAYTNGFESGVLTPFTTDGDSLWTVVSGVPNSGSFSAKAGSNPGCACAKVTNLRLVKTLTTSGTISFYRKLSLNGYTYKFQIDGVDQESITTDSGFTQATFAVSSGAHTFTWLYSSGASPVANPVYIDDVVVTNTSGAANALLVNGGQVGIGTTTPGATLHVVATTASSIGQIVQAYVSQTADLLQIQNSGAVNLAKFDANGNLAITANINTLASVAGAGTAAANALAITGQTGGATSGAATTAGIGGGISLLTGTGGAGTGTNAVGGAGGSFSLTSGAGGASAGTGANSNGGNITVQGGAAGVGGSGAAGARGNIILQSAGGNVGVGTSGTPAALLSVGGTTGNFQVDTNGNVLTGTTITGTSGLTIAAGGSNTNFNLNSNGGGGINIGTNAGTNTNGIAIGNTTGNGTQTISIGINATGGSTTNVTIGSTVAGSTIVQSSTTTLTTASAGVLVKTPVTNQAAAFQVQNASNQDIFTVNTTGTAVNIGTAAATTLNVTGSQNLTGNIAVTNTAVGTVAAVIQGAASQTADLLDVKTNAAANPQFAINNVGLLTLQSSSATVLFTADVVNGIVKVGNPGSTFSSGTNRLFVTQAEFSGQVTIGTSGGYSQFSGSTGELTLSGTAQHSKSVVLTAEYAGAVLDAASDTAGTVNGTGAVTVNCSTNSTGTMTAGLTTGATGFGNTNVNYYNWTSAETTAQCYDIVVQVPVPSDFAGWNGTTPISAQTWTDSTANTQLNLELRNTTGGSSAVTGYNYVSILPGSNSTWTTSTVGASIDSSANYTPGSYMTLRIRVNTKSNANVRIGNIILNYKSKF